MASRENSKADSQTASKINVSNKVSDNQSYKATVLASPFWNQPPLCWLSDEQKTLLQQSDTLDFRLGEKIWSQEAVGYQFLIISGKVRLREEGIGKPLATLESGQWFGDLNNYPTECKAVAASKEVLVLRTSTDLWAELSTPQIEQFWNGGETSGEGDKETRGQGDKETRGQGDGEIRGQGDKETRGQGDKIVKISSPSPPSSSSSPISPSPILPTHPITSGYPFVSSANSAAACLTMVAQYLEISVKLEWVQRQVRSQRPQTSYRSCREAGFGVAEVAG